MGCLACLIVRPWLIDYLIVLWYSVFLFFDLFFICFVWFVVFCVFVFVVLLGLTLIVYLIMVVWFVGLFVSLFLLVCVLTDCCLVSYTCCVCVCLLRYCSLVNFGLWICLLYVYVVFIGYLICLFITGWGWMLFGVGVLLLIWFVGFVWVGCSLRYACLVGVCYLFLFRFFNSVVLLVV